MALFNDEVRQQTREILKKMQDPVRVTYFTREAECEMCSLTDSFVEELSGLEQRIEVIRKDFVEDQELAATMGIHQVPALALSRGGEERAGVRYYGLPAGHEFGAFLRLLLMFSVGQPVEAVDLTGAEGIDRETNLKVFVLVTCPSCPAMAYLAGALALVNSRITAEIIEANAFAELSRRFKVSTVPKSVINDTLEVVGAVPASELIEKIKSLR